MTAQFDYDQLASDIREFMAENKIKGKDFCKLCGVTEPSLSRVLSGKTRNGSSGTVAKIASVLGFSMNHYITQHHRSYETMTIEELTELMETIREIRNRKIEHKLVLLRDKTELYEKLLKESED